MKSNSQNSLILGSNSNNNNLRGKGGNIIQKPLRTECSPKNYSNNSFTLNQTQPFQLNVKRYSIEPTSITQRLVQNSSKRNTTYIPQQNQQTKQKEKENINFPSQYGTITFNKDSQVFQNNKGSQVLLQNSQHSILNNSGSNLYSSRATTHQFEQKLNQQQQLNNSQVQQLSIQPIDFLDMSKTDLKLSQVLSPTSPTRLNSSTCSQSKERIQSSKNLSKINCKNHNTVQASYYAIENRVVSYFCTQCSAQLIKKGLKLHEIINSQLASKKPLHQINLNSFQQNQGIIPSSNTPMKLSLGQHKMINLHNQQGTQKVNQQRNTSIPNNITNSPNSSILSPSSTILTPRQQSVTIPVNVFEPFTINNQEVLLSQQQTPTLNVLNNNDEDYEEPFDLIMARNNIKDLQGDKAKVKEYLEDLMNRIDNVKALSYDKLEKLENKKLQLHDFYEFQKQIILEKMLELITIIEQEKQNSLKNIEIQKNDNISELNSMESNLKQQIKDMKNIRSDIKDNICNIFNNLDLKPFRVIYNKYNDKLEQFTAAIRKVDQSNISYSILNPNNITSYLHLLTNQSNKPFLLETRSDLITLNLIQNLQSLFPKHLNPKQEDKQSFIDQNTQQADSMKFGQQTPQNSKSHQQDNQSEISQEDTPRNNEKNKQMSKDQNNKKTTRENQVYVSFNNKNIFQNDLANQIETLNDEQNQEPIPMVSLNLSSNKKSSDEEILGISHPTEQAKLKMQKLLREDSNENEKGIFTIKEEDNINNNSLLNQTSTQQINSNQFTSSILSNQYNSNQFNSNLILESQIQNLAKLDQIQDISNSKNLINSQNEYGLANNLSKESIDIINLDTYKQTPLQRQTSPSRNSFNSQTGGKGRGTCKSPNSLKYLELIDKINTNQLNTNMFYQTLIRDNQIVSSQSDNNTNTFTVQLQKIQTNNPDSNKSSSQYNKLYSDLNSSLNIQTSQVIFNDPVQKINVNSGSILEIGNISPISVTPNSNYYLSSITNTQTKPLSSPTITKNITFPNNQVHNYQKKLF